MKGMLRNRLFQVSQLAYTNFLIRAFVALIRFFVMFPQGFLMFLWSGFKHFTISSVIPHSESLTVSFFLYLLCHSSDPFSKQIL